MVMSSLGKVSAVAYNMACEGPAVAFTVEFDIVCGIEAANQEHHAIPCSE